MCMVIKHLAATLGFHHQTPLKMSLKNVAKMDGVHGPIGPHAHEVVTVELPNKYDDATQLIVAVNQSATESVICR